ncbi:23S rRNA (uracil(1939)-C(5))-methyltransferase RlmD [Natronospora cellulosivora (SeqCode)]
MSEDCKIKKGEKLDLIIDNIKYPNTGVAFCNKHQIQIKNVLPGQKVKVRIKKKKKKYYEGKLLEILENSPLEGEKLCEHYNNCGGCNRQRIGYEKQLDIKENQIKELFKINNLKDINFLGIESSPNVCEYRNKMEFTFGDYNKDGYLQLGMHPQGKRFDIVTVETCILVDSDFRMILQRVLNHFRKLNFKKYHVISKEGYLRNLVIRKGLKTGEILVNIITTSQNKYNFDKFTQELLDLNLKGNIVSILHTINDDYADAVKCDKLINLYGKDYYTENIMNLSFKITPFAFFQPNTLGAERLYDTVLDFIQKPEDKIVYDLYCGTGTISQFIAKKAKKVYGIEIIKEAIEIAKNNAKLNNLDNCTFKAGDVLDKLKELKEKADIIIIDPPRPGIHPKALEDIIKVEANEIIYVSCNPKTLVRDLKEFTNHKYKIKKVKCVDMFPHTHHLETVVHLIK